MNAIASNRQTTLAFSAASFTSGTNWKSTNSLPDVERRHEEVVQAAAMTVAWMSSFGLRAALLPGDEHLGDRRRLGVRVLAVRLAHEVAAQRDQEQDAQAAAGEADEDRLQRVRRRAAASTSAGSVKIAPATTDADTPPIPVMITFWSSGGSFGDDARQPDREDRDRDRRLHDLADLEPRVRRGDREDHAEEQPPEHRDAGRLGKLRSRRDDRLVHLARLQRLVGVLGKRLGIGCVHPGSPSGAVPSCAISWADRRIVKQDSFRGHPCQCIVWRS